MSGRGRERGRKGESGNILNTSELRLALYMHNVHVHVPLPSPVRPPRGWWPVLGR